MGRTRIALRTWTGKLAFSFLAAIVFTLDSAAATRYVDLNCPNATAPFTDWTTAATDIQSAVDAANPGDTVLVTNGIYVAGARLTSDGTQNRLVVTNAVTVQSVNGAYVTSIDAPSWYVARI